MITVRYNGQEYFFREGTSLTEIKDQLVSHIGGLDSNARLNQDASNPLLYTLVPGPQVKG